MGKKENKKLKKKLKRMYHELRELEWDNRDNRWCAEFDSDVESRLGKKFDAVLDNLALLYAYPRLQTMTPKWKANVYLKLNSIPRLESTGKFPTSVEIIEWAWDYRTTPNLDYFLSDAISSMPPSATPNRNDPVEFEKMAYSYLESFSEVLTTVGYVRPDQVYSFLEMAGFVQFPYAV